MKKVFTVLLVLIVLFSCFATAESGDSPYDYLVEQGYSPERVDDSPGWRTLQLLENDENWILNFSDDVDSWAILVLMDYAPGFDITGFQSLFVTLVQNFDWDVSFYWPDYDSGNKILLSYNIKNDLDKTEKNFTDKAMYFEALCDEFSFAQSDIDDEFSTTQFSPEWLAEQYNTMSNGSFAIKADYIENSDTFIYIIQSTDISPATWILCDESVKIEYRNTISQLSSAALDTLDSMGYGDTTVFTLFQLNDSSCIYMMVNNVDCSLLFS